MTYVTVSVPEHLLGEVYALLLDALGPDDALRSGEAVPVRGNGSWTQLELAELARRLTHPGGRAVMDAIARAGLAGTGASYEELRVAGAAAMEDGELSFDQLRAQLAWIGRYGSSIHGVKESPIEVTDLGRAYAAGQRYRYTMPRRVAEWWLDLSSGR